MSFRNRNSRRIFDARRKVKNIEKILNGQSLVFVSIYISDIKFDRRYRLYSSQYYYVNFEFDKKYGDIPNSELVDLIQEIEKCLAV